MSRHAVKKGQGLIRDTPLLRSYRELLGVTPESSQAEIKKAFYQMALLYHPDRNPHPQASEQFARVRAAFDILSNPEKSRELHAKHLEAKWREPLVDGLQICLGSFFGYRFFAPEGNHLKLAGRKSREQEASSWSVVEDVSILDHPAYDAIEVVFAGRFSEEDELRLQKEGHSRQARDLPWVVLNNQGLYHVMQGEFAKALSCYEQLNERVPGNLIFLYRLAVCELVLAYRHRRRNMLGQLRPDRRRRKRALRLLYEILQRGERRPVGRQKCMTVRKLLVEVLSHSGWQRRRVLRAALDLQPKSIELLYRSGSKDEARQLARRKQPRKNKLTQLSAQAHSHSRNKR